MTKRRPIHAGVLGACLWCLLLGSADRTLAQTPAPKVPADPCAQPIQCGAPIFLDTFAKINLEPGADSVCRFNPRIIQDLRLDLADHVTWSFCNACNTAMTVQLDTNGPGFMGRGHFDLFMPFPQADNLVSLTVPCKGWGEIYGANARQSGDWKYSLRAKVADATTFPDVIDPRLEIDDRGFKRMVWGAIAVGAGLLTGFLVGRRFSRRQFGR